METALGELRIGPRDGRPHWPPCSEFGNEGASEAFPTRSRGSVSSAKIAYCPAGNDDTLVVINGTAGVPSFLFARRSVCRVATH